MIAAGALRHVVTIEQQVSAENSLGEPAVSWATFASDVRAEIKPISGRAYMEAKQAQSEVSHRVRIRYLDGVAASMRVIFDGRRLEIEAVIDFEERHQEMLLMCVERSGNG